MGIPQLFIIGDSISMQYGPYLKQALLEKVDVLRKGDLPGEENLDANGRDSYEVVRYLETLIKRKFKTDLLLLNCGLHDIKRLPPHSTYQVEPDQYLKNLKHIVSLFSQVAPRMVWVTTTPVVDAIHNSRNPDFQRYNADVLRYNKIAAAVMTENDIPVIDLNRFTTRLDDQSDLYEDHVHFQEPIRMLQGNYIAGCIQIFLNQWEQHAI